MLAAIEAEEKGSRSRLRVAATASEYSLIFSMCRRCSSGSAGACLGELGGHAGSSRGEAAAGSARGSRKRPWRPLLGVVGNNGRGVVGNMSRRPRGNVGRLLSLLCLFVALAADSSSRACGCFVTPLLENLLPSVYGSRGDSLPSCITKTRPHSPQIFQKTLRRPPRAAASKQIDGQID